MKTVLISLPDAVKAKLDALRVQGTTRSGFIRYLLEREFARREVRREKMKRILVALPEPLKRKLDALRAQGYTASGYIRAVLEKELNQVQVKDQKGR